MYEKVLYWFWTLRLNLDAENERCKLVNSVRFRCDSFGARPTHKFKWHFATKLLQLILEIKPQLLCDCCFPDFM